MDGLKYCGSIVRSVASIKVKAEMKKAFTSEWTGKEIVFGVLALAAGATSAVAVATDGTFLTKTVSTLSVLGGVTTLVLQKKLTTLGNLRQLNNETREEINELEEENDRLSQENEEMHESISQLGKAEVALEDISMVQEVGVRTLIKQISQYKLVQQELKEAVRDKTRQTIITCVLNTDTDKNFTIDRRELDVLCEILDSIPNVQFNEQAFRDAIRAAGGDIAKFSKQHLKRCSVMERERIFILS